MTPMTAQEKATNRAKRLTEAASPLDGITVRILHKFASHGTEPGAVVILSKDTAEQAIRDGLAELAE